MRVLLRGSLNRLLPKNGLVRRDRVTSLSDVVQLCIDLSEKRVLWAVNPLPLFAHTSLTSPNAVAIRALELYAAQVIVFAPRRIK